MKKRFLNSKRMMAFMLALSLVLGEAGIVTANPVSAEENVVSENSISINDAADEPVEQTGISVETEEVDAEGAYDGSVSKVIGLEGGYYWDGSISVPDGKTLKYVYVNRKEDGVRLIGTSAQYQVKDAYLYTHGGKYYYSATTNTRDNTVYLYNQVQLSATEPQMNATTGLYTIGTKSNLYYNEIVINGKTYYYLYPDEDYKFLGVYNTSAEAQNVTRNAVKGSNDNALYYVMGGKNYSYRGYTSYRDGKYYAYADAYDEISFTAQYVDLEWIPLSTENHDVTADGKEIRIGYQVEENGVPMVFSSITSDGKYSFTTSTYAYGNAVIQPGQSAKYRVRGLYYTVNENAKTQAGDTYTQYNVVSVGEWSEEYIYKAAALKTMPKVTGVQLTATHVDYNGNAGVNYEVKWSSLEVADYYRYKYLISNVPLTGLTGDNWDQFRNQSGDAYEKLEQSYPNEDIITSGSYGWSTVTRNYISGTVTADLSCKYMYFIVTANSYNTAEYSTDVVYSDIVSTSFVTENIPQIKDLRIEKSVDGDTFKIVWTPVNAKVVIYATKLKSFPQLYNYSLLSARYKNENGNNVYLYNEMDDALYDTIWDNVNYIRVDGNQGYLNSSQISLTPGVEYLFVAHTYDESTKNVERTKPFTYDGKAYYYYTSMSAPSNIVKAKRGLAKPEVVTAADTNQIKLTMDPYYGEVCTGYEIYKKSGKKYKKIATTTDNVYVDKGLKKNTEYSYKVRSYNYDKDTKVKCYSAYTYVTGETSTVNGIDVKVKQTSKTSVQLQWNKVKGATKYEVYRTTGEDGSPLEASKKFSADGKTMLVTANAKYELVKTLKASAKKYKDRKLTSGESYTYVVLAYYKNGKTTQYIQDSCYVAMQLESPALKSSLKGTTAKFTWDKNKYASKYEIRYKVCDINGKEPKEWTYISTKKAALTVKNVKDGMRVMVSIRAVSKSAQYSEWSGTAYVYNGLAVTKKITAKTVTVKNAAGVSRDAVKITWKSVSGAKYYKVYRSLRQNITNMDAKSYLVEYGDYIAKDSNDDEGINVVYYDQYLKEQGSIVGTTAYDYAQLDPGVTYYYYVVAFGERGTNVYSAFSENSTSYGSGKPASVTYKAAATIKKITNKKKGKAVLTWSKVAGANKYYVYRSTKKGSGYKLIGSTKKATFTDKKVKKGTTYYYKIEVRGTNALKASFAVMSSAKKIKIKK